MIRHPFHVQRVLGLKNIQNALVYVNIVGFDDNENYICPAVTTKEERIALIESGFTFVAAHGEEWYFKKRN